ncbi:MAG: hypothetical protein WA110_05985 [Anaerolineaceae bacterium]
MSPSSASHSKTPEKKPVKKALPTIIWIVVIVLQVLAGYETFALVRVLLVPVVIKDRSSFFILAAALVLSISIAVWLVGLLGLRLRKVKPAKAWLRLLATFGLALVPCLIMVYLGTTVGFKDLEIFQDVVVGRMIPYYTNLALVLGMLGFYVSEWAGVFKTQKKTK